MCVIFVAWREHARLPLIVAANRDEFYARPAAPAHWWDIPPILAGRDLEGGGTWLGLTRGGRFAALTNYRDPGLRRAQAASRGAIVTSLLESAAPVSECIGWLGTEFKRFNPFSVIFSDGADLAVFESVPGHGRLLPAGIYALSNHLLDTPWPKVEMLKMRMLSALSTDPADTRAALALLRDARRAPDEALPHTGVSLEWERLLSSVFVRESTYGTRCSTLIRQNLEGRVDFDEWTWDREGTAAGHVRQTFVRESPPGG